MSYKFGKIIWLIILILIVVAGVYVYNQKAQKTPASALVDPNVYQAITLSGNQLYFGKLEQTNSQWVVLKDVYYLRERAEQLQPVKEEEKTVPQPKFDLIKLGNEIHQPQDSLMLNQEQILYWVNLKPDSQVIKTIEQLKTQKK